MSKDRYRGRDAVTGRFIKKTEAKRRPRTTVVETPCNKIKKKQKKRQ